MRKVAAFVSLSFLGTFLGCMGIQVTYIPLKQGYFPAVRQAKDISVITGIFREPYEELGIILIRKGPGSLEEEMMDKFREEAMIRGAEAVIKVRAEKHAIFSLAPFFISFPFQGIEARGVAIRFKRENALAKKP